MHIVHTRTEPLYTEPQVRCIKVRNMFMFGFATIPLGVNLLTLRLTLSQLQILSHSLALSLLQHPIKELLSTMEPSGFLLQWQHDVPWNMARRKICGQSSLDTPKTNLQHHLMGMM